MIDDNLSLRNDPIADVCQVVIQRNNVSSMNADSPTSQRHIVLKTSKPIIPTLLVVSAFLGAIAYEGYIHIPGIRGAERTNRMLQAASEPSHVDTLIDNLSGFKDNWDPLERGDHPVFWHIPKSGGSSIKNYLGSCYGMVMASEVGVKEHHERDIRLKVIVNKGNNRFVNVDTTTVQGIRRAKEMGFADSGLAGVTISPLLYDIETLFSKAKPGRVFAFFRDPIDRAISMFNYLQYAEWEPTYNGKLRTMTLDDYARSDFIEDNMLTRMLVNKKRGALSEKDVTTAADVIRRKVLVGLMSDIGKSLDRFERFFEWQFHDTRVQEECRQNLLTFGGNTNKMKAEKPERGSATYEALAAKNRFDIRLYSYIQKVFDEQECFVQSKPNDYRLLPP